MSMNYTKSEHLSEGNNEAVIRRTFDGSIDFRYYERNAHDLRSAKAWDIFRAMGQLLPFYREPDESLHLHNAGCTMR